jgi:hypothetical protein
MPDLIEPQAATLDCRNRGAPWAGPTCPTYPTIKEGGNTSTLGVPRAPARHPPHDFSKLAGLVGQVGQRQACQWVTAPNLVGCSRQVGPEV